MEAPRHAGGASRGRPAARKSALTARAQDVFALLGAEDVRRIRAEHTANLSMLVNQAVKQMATFVDSPAPAYRVQALNCVRILSRVMPVLLENDDDGFLTSTFWSAAGDDPPLAQKLVHTLVRMCFVPGFTVGDDEHSRRRADDADVDATVPDHALVWCVLRALARARARIVALS